MVNAQSNSEDQKQQVASQAEDVKEQVSQKAEELTDQASDVYENVKHSLNQAGHNIQEQSEHMYEAMLKYVKENPLKAVGMAALGGSLLAMMLCKMGD